MNCSADIVYKSFRILDNTPYCSIRAINSSRELCRRSIRTTFEYRPDAFSNLRRYSLWPYRVFHVFSNNFRFFFLSILKLTIDRDDFWKNIEILNSFPFTNIYRLTQCQIFY